MVLHYTSSHTKLNTNAKQVQDSLLFNPLTQYNFPVFSSIYVAYLNFCALLSSTKIQTASDWLYLMFVTKSYFISCTASCKYFTQCQRRTKYHQYLLEHVQNYRIERQLRNECTNPSTPTQSPPVIFSLVYTFKLLNQSSLALATCSPRLRIFNYCISLKDFAFLAVK